MFILDVYREVVGWQGAEGEGSFLLPRRTWTTSWAARGCISMLVQETGTKETSGYEPSC